MKKTKVQALAYGAVCTALTVLLSIMSLYVPFLSVPMIFFAGVPLMYVSIGCGSRMASLSAVVSILILFILTGNFLSAVFTGISNILPGVAAGYCLGHRREFKQTVFATSAFVMLGLFAELAWINASGGGNGLENLITGSIDNARTIVFSVLDGASELKGTDVTVIAEVLDEALGTAKGLIMLYMPSLLIGISAVIGYLITAIGIFMLSRLGVKNLGYTPFWAIDASRMMCFAAAALYLFSSFSNGTEVLSAGVKNLTALMLAYICVCGMSYVDFSVKKRIKSGYLRTLIYAGVFVFGYFLSGFVMYILTILGMIDGCFGLRHFNKAGE